MAEEVGLTIHHHLMTGSRRGSQLQHGRTGPRPPEVKALNPGDRDSGVVRLEEPQQVMWRVGLNNDNSSSSSPDKVEAGSVEEVVTLEEEVHVPVQAHLTHRRGTRAQVSVRRVAGNDVST